MKCCKDDASEIYKNSFKQEAINLMKLDNKFIVRFLGVSYTDSEISKKDLYLNVTIRYLRWKRPNCVMKV